MTPARQQQHCNHECVCYYVEPSIENDGNSPCRITCEHDTRTHTPAAPATEPMWSDEDVMRVSAEAAKQARKAEREQVLDAFGVELQEIKSRIESSAMGKPLSERERGRIIGILDARVKLESLRSKEQKQQ